MMLAVVMVFGLCSPAWAATPTEIEEASEISPRYISSCPNSAKHHMTGRGVGWVYSGSLQAPGTLQIYGFAEQCKNCHLVLISEGNPRWSGTLGKYALWNPSCPISNTGAVIYGGYTGTFEGDLLSDAFWGGFDFTY